MKKFNFSLMGGGGIFLFLFVATQGVVNAQLDWCSSQNCFDCEPYIGNLSKDKQVDMDRVMYVNNFLTLDQNEVNIVNNLSPNGLQTILGFPTEERELFEYAVDNGFSTLILYNVPALLRVGGNPYDGDVTRLDYAQELTRFITIAKQVYGLEVGFALSDKKLWENISNVYDLFSSGSVIDFTTLDKCNDNWRVIDGGSLNGGYFQVGDIPRIYPEDGEGRNHPLDEAIIDMYNIYLFRYNNDRPDRVDWWTEIWDVIRIGYEDIIDGDGCAKKYVANPCPYTVYVEDPDPIDPNPDDDPIVMPMPGTYSYPCEALFHEICHSFSRLVTEFEFWKNEDYTFPDVTVNSSVHKIYNITESFDQFIYLLEMMYCLEDQIIDDPTGEGISEWENCRVKKDVYLMQLTSSGFTYNGKQIGTKNYVLNDWEIDASLPLYHDLGTYDFDAANQYMADKIDLLADRIYLATYHQTPCQLWSDDLGHNSSSYRRRFKDVYSYFSGNNIGKLTGDKTEIYPLFSARHPLIEDAANLPPASDHLGLFLALNQCGGLNLTENIFNHFSQKNSLISLHPSTLNNTMIVPCDNTTVPNNNEIPNVPNTPLAALNIDLQNPTNWDRTGDNGDFFVVTVTQDGFFDVLSSSTETFVTVWNDHPQNNNVVMFGRTPLYVELLNGTDYYVSINQHRDHQNYQLDEHKGACGVNNTSTPRTITFDHVAQKQGFYTSDPRPDEISSYDNVVNGYAWYRYRELNGKNTVFSQPFYKNSPTSNNEQENLREPDFKIYPNPNNIGVLNVEGVDNALFTIYDLTGKRVLEGKLQSQSISINTLKSGFYTLVFNVSGEFKTQKLIINK